MADQDAEGERGGDEQGPEVAGIGRADVRRDQPGGRASGAGLVAAAKGHTECGESDVRGGWDGAGRGEDGRATGPKAAATFGEEEEPVPELAGQEAATDDDGEQDG